MKNKRCTIIGAGNVGAHLATALHGCGFEIIQVFSRKQQRAANLAELAGAAPITTLSAVSGDADVYFVCVPDDEIASVTAGLPLKGKFVFHTSGSTPLLGGNGQQNGVFYPLQSFSSGRQPNWKTIPLLLEAENPKAEAILSSIAGALSEKVLVATSQERLVVHLAAVIASNFSNHLLHQASALLEKENFDLKLLQPLVEETVAKAFANGPLPSQTGPARRHDEKTLRLHLQLLENHPYLHQLYKTISGSIEKTYPL